MKRVLLKRLMAVLILACLLFSEISYVTVYASEMMDSESAEEKTASDKFDDAEIAIESETLLVDDTVQIETEGVREESETILDEETEIIIQDNEVETETETVEETETSDEIKVITGFVPLDAYESRIDSSVLYKPDLEELLSVMPETLRVYLNDEKELSEIEVGWSCVGDDYENSSSHYFQFSPTFDESKYVLSNDIDLLTEAPYIGVFLEEGSGISTMSVTSGSMGENETEIFYFLVNEMRLNQAAACGILANIYGESAFSPTVVGDKGTSYGICQWHDTSTGYGRFTDLKNYCIQNGYDYTTLEGQLYFLKYELQTSYPTIYNYMRNISNTEAGAYDAGYYWCYNFEIPANKGKTSITRGNLAKNTYWPEYCSIQIVPEITSIKNVSNGVNLKWKAVTDANGYYIYRRAASSGSWSLVGTINDGSVLSYTDKSVSSNTTYHYTIEAYYCSQTFDEYRTVEALNYRTGAGTSYAIAGTLSKGTTVQVISGSSITADGYTWYEIYYKGNYYFVSSSYLEKVSESSVSPNVTTSEKALDKSILYIASPEVSSATNVNGGIKVTWEKVAGAKGYYVYRKTAGTGYSRIGKVSGRTVYTDKTGKSGTTYTYTVRAYSGSTKSSYNSDVDILCLTVPDVSAATAVGEGVRVTWKKVAGATGYYIYRKKDGGKYSCIGKVTSGSTVNYKDKKVDSDNTYIYTVRAYSGRTKSSYNKQVNIYYLSSPVLVNAENTDKGIKVTWEKVTGATGYYVYRKQSGSSWSYIANISKGSTVAYTDSKAKNGTAYTYTVRAYRGSYRSYYDTKGVTNTLNQSLSSYKTTENVNYRTGPGTTYSIAGTLRKGTAVQVVDGYSKKASGYTWYKIYLNGKYFYVSSSYLQASSSTQSSQKLIGYKTTAAVNYRTGPGTTYSIAGTLSKGTAVKVVSGYSKKANSYTWYKIYRNGKYYYVSSSYLKKS